MMMMMGMMVMAIITIIVVIIIITVIAIATMTMMIRMMMVIVTMAPAGAVHQECLYVEFSLIQLWDLSPPTASGTAPAPGAAERNGRGVEQRQADGAAVSCRVLFYDLFYALK